MISINSIISITSLKLEVLETEPLNFRRIEHVRSEIIFYVTRLSMPFSGYLFLYFNTLYSKLCKPSLSPTGQIFVHAAGAILTRLRSLKREQVPLTKEPEMSWGCLLRNQEQEMYAPIPVLLSTTPSPQRKTLAHNNCQLSQTSVSLKYTPEMTSSQPFQWFGVVAILHSDHLRSPLNYRWDTLKAASE